MPKSFICNVCGSGFTCNGNLKRHYRDFHVYNQFLLDFKNMVSSGQLLLNRPPGQLYGNYNGFVPIYQHYITFPSTIIQPNPSLPNPVPQDLPNTLNPPALPQDLNSSNALNPPATGRRVSTLRLPNILPAIPQDLNPPNASNSSAVAQVPSSTEMNHLPNNPLDLRLIANSPNAVQSNLQVPSS